MALFAKKDKRIGSAKGRHKYDLPLNHSVGTGFLIVMIALMTFLAILSLSGSATLGAISHHWSSGLENKMTIEIPAEEIDGEIRSDASIATLTQKAAEKLKASPHVKKFEVMDSEAVQSLLSPWLGEDVKLQGIPVPGLISAEMNATTPAIIDQMTKAMQNISPNIQVDTHETWLNDLLRITSALQTVAALIAAVVGVTTIIAIAGSMRTRMAIHHEDIELLHLMGASDGYIAGQFQRHALILSFKGALAGTLAAGAALGGIHMLAGETAQALLPEADLTVFYSVMLLATPAIVCVIAAVAARFTVLRVLAMMP